MKSIMNVFESHPIFGFAFTCFHLAVGCVIALQKQAVILILPMLHIHQPPIVAEILQDGAWVMAISAGAFTCYGIYRTWHGKNKRK